MCARGKAVFLRGDGENESVSGSAIIFSLSKSRTVLYFFAFRLRYLICPTLEPSSKHGETIVVFAAFQKHFKATECQSKCWRHLLDLSAAPLSRKGSEKKEKCLILYFPILFIFKSPGIPNGNFPNRQLEPVARCEVVFRGPPPKAGVGAKDPGRDARIRADQSG